MKISANRDDLLKPLQQVVGVVERRQTLPILANVLISVKDNDLSLTATDLEVELKTRTRVQCSGEIEFTLPARKLMDICKALPESADTRWARYPRKTTRVSNLAKLVRPSVFRQAP
jgi:DNA polymerase-3 subunit beta